MARIKVSNAEHRKPVLIQLHFEHIQTRSDRLEVFRKLKVHIPRDEKGFDKSMKNRLDLRESKIYNIGKIDWEISFPKKTPLNNTVLTRKTTKNSEIN